MSTDKYFIITTETLRHSREFDQKIYFSCLPEQIDTPIAFGHQAICFFAHTADQTGSLAARLAHSDGKFVTILLQGEGEDNLQRNEQSLDPVIRGMSIKNMPVVDGMNCSL